MSIEKRIVTGSELLIIRLEIESSPNFLMILVRAWFSPRPAQYSAHSNWRILICCDVFEKERVNFFICLKTLSFRGVIEAIKGKKYKQ